MNARVTALSPPRPSSPEEKDRTQSAQPLTEPLNQHTELPVQPLAPKRNPFKKVLAGIRSLVRRAFRHRR